MNILKNAVANTAPLLGSILGGPLGASAGHFLGKILLGDEQAPPSAVEAAITNPSPTQRIALQQIEADLQAKLSQAATDREKLAVQDRDSARLREIQVRDKIPAILAILLTMGFFTILSVIMFFPIETDARPIIDVMLGALGTAWISCITYYFGSSHGSQTKNILWAGQLGQSMDNS